MCLTAKAISMSHAKFHRNRLTIVQDIQDYVSLIFFGHSVDIHSGQHQQVYTTCH